MQLTNGKVGQFQEHLIQADYSNTTEDFLQLLKQGYRLAPLVQAAVDAAAPYLTVPSHIMVNLDGELRGVNYDHCVLGLRASRRMLPYLPREHGLLPMAQAVWYMPQGLDVWDQLLCEFPGHYARDDAKCGQKPGGTTPDGKDRFDGPAWNAPKAWFNSDHAPILDGSVDERLHRLQVSIMEGDKQTAYQLAVGLRQELDPSVRPRLESQVLFCGIIDLQETLQSRKLQNIGHKALRARALVELADLVGWDNSNNLFHCVIPDLASSPRLYPIFDLSTNLLGARFKNELYTLKQRNDQPLTDEERTHLVGLMLNGKAPAVTAQLTELLGQGKRLIEIADTLMAAYAVHVVDEIWSKKSMFQLGHAFDYANVVNFWLRNYEHPHQAKAVYFQALFINDCIQINKAFPKDPNHEFFLGEWKPFQHWAGGLSLNVLLGELVAACERLDYPRAMACTNSYLERTEQRQPLVQALTVAASKLQNDPHQARNAASSIEEWELTTAIGYRDMLLRAWVVYCAGSAKRTTAQDCTRMFERQFGVGPTQSVVASTPGTEQDLGVMGLTLAKPVDAPADAG